MLKNLQLDHYQKKFINHNQIFKKKKQHSKNKILVEFNGWQPFHLTNSYLLNVLKEKNNAEIIAYENYSLLLPKKQSILNKAKWHIGSKFKIKTFKIYDSFGASKFIKPDFSKEIKNKTFYTFNNNILKIKSLRDLENFKCNSILIGDLLYDSYLKKYLEPTIDLTSLKFKKFSIEFLKLFYFWENYFKKNKITAVSASHGVYSFAIPLRISLSRKIDSFVPVEDKIYNFKHFSKFKNFSPTSVFMENLFFKKIFNRFSSKNKKKYIKIGKKIILNNKKNNFNYPYVRKKINRKKIKILSKKPGILILSHSFFDSPHVYGNNLFPDFKHWFNFLSKLINKTENKYSWYIKPHPNKFDLSNKEIKNFLKKNKKVNLIKTNYNFKEYQKLKIKVILTVFGQISKESVLHKILCINASKCTPERTNTSQNASKQ